MTKPEGNPNDEARIYSASALELMHQRSGFIPITPKAISSFGHSSLFRASSFVIRHFQTP